MCFSASASFVMTGATTVTGIAALSGVRSPPQRMLAAIPLLFAIHQAAEGVVWLTLTGTGPPSLHIPAVFTYLMVSKVVWPTWVPLAILLLEENPRRRQALVLLAGLGVLVSIGEAYALSKYPVQASERIGHIRYDIDSPSLLRWPVDIGYVVVIVLPLLISSNRMVRVIGVLVLASFLTAKVLYPLTTASTWCFFAAIISIIIVAVVKTAPHRREAGP